MPEPTECDPATHEWVKSKGIDIATTGCRGIAITQVSGTYLSGIAIQSPPLIDGIPEFKFTILNRTSSFFEIEALTDPSIDEDNNLLASVRMNAFDSNGNEIASKTFTFSTITNGDYTPGRLRIEIPNLTISTVTIDVLSLPTEFSGIWIESITFNRVPIGQSTDIILLQLPFHFLMIFRQIMGYLKQATEKLTIWILLRFEHTMLSTALFQSFVRRLRFPISNWQGFSYM